MRRPAGATSLAAVVVALTGCTGLGTFTTSTDTIGSEGGVVATADGTVRVQVPPGVLEQAAEVSIEELDGGAIDDLSEGLGQDVEVPFLAPPVRVGVDDVAAGPLQLEIDLPTGEGAGGLPVLAGVTDDGEVVVPERQEVTIRQGQPVLVAELVEPGGYAALGGSATVSLDPLYVTAFVGDAFSSSATITVAPDVAGDEATSLFFNLWAMGSDVAEVLVPGSQWAGRVGDDTPQADMKHNFRCVRAGRGTFGTRVKLEGTDWSEASKLGDVLLGESAEQNMIGWRTGVVDCVEAGEDGGDGGGSGVVSVLDDLQTIVVGGAQLGPGEPSEDPSSTTGSVQPMVAGGVELVTFSPRAVITHVGRTFSVEALLGLAGGSTGPVTARITPVSGDGPVEPASAPVDVPLDATTPTVGVQAAFTCGGVGSAAIGLELTETSAEEGGATGEGRFLPAVVKCLEAPGAGEPTWITYPGDLPPSSLHVAVEGGEAAALPGTLQGPCEGSATIDGHGTIDPAVSGGVYRVPREGSARYRGSIDAPGGEQRTHNGSVVLHTPAGFPPVTIGSWSGAGVETSASGSQSWSLDALWTPAGALLPVSAVHNDTAGTCTATVVVEFDGGFTDSPIGAVSLGMTLLGLGGLGVGGGSLFPKKP